MPSSTKIEAYIRIDGFVLLIERHQDRLRLGFADEHDRNELLSYFASAIHNHELAENLALFKRINESGVLWYYPYQPTELAQLSMVVEFNRIAQDYEFSRGHKIDEPVWTYKFAPTMLHSAFIAHSTAQKIIAISKAVSEGSREFPEGVEVYDEDQWMMKFDPEAQKGLLLPSILRRLEDVAVRYVQLFEKNSREYSPDTAEFWRREIFKELESQKLVDCDIPPVVFQQLKKYPALSRCVNTAEYLRGYLDLAEKGQKTRDCPLSLDWMMFDPYFPEGVETWDALSHALAVVAAANLESPRTLATEIGGEPYRLVTGWDHGQIKLLHAVALDARSVSFHDVYRPTFLELLEWAALERNGSPAMEWDLVVNWEDYFDFLPDLATDASLPGGEYFLHCIYCYLAGLQRHEPRKMLALAESLSKHAEPVIRRISERTRALQSGEIQFNADDWFSAGFIRKDRAAGPAQASAKNRRSKL